MTFQIQKIKSNPKEYVETESIDEIVNFIKYATDKYENQTEVITDQIFDIIWNGLKERDPNNKVFNLVGAPIRNDMPKTTLPYRMPSLDKIKPTKNTLSKWLNNFPSKEYHISEKLDGLSVMVVYNPEPKLYTRGNGIIGRDVSYLIPYLNIPKTLPKHISLPMAIRGELIMSNETFKNKYSSLFPKVRSVVTGLIISNKPNPDTLKDSEIVFYEIMYPKNMKHSEQLQTLINLKIKTVKYYTTNNISLEGLIKTLQEYRNKSKYPTDGIVIGDDSKPYNITDKATPEHSFAFKMALDEQRKKTTVIRVNWKPSKHNKLSPQIHYEPVIIGGDTFQYTSGFNARYIYQNKIGKGTKITIIRSGDVIPYIDNIEKSTEADMPTSKWHWGKSNVDIYLDNPAQDTDKAILKHFFTTLQIPYINVGVIDKLYNSGYDTISKLYYMSKSDLLEIGGIKETMSDKIYSSIHDILDKPIDLGLLMTASNQFGHGFGIKKFQPLLDKYSNSNWHSISFEEIQNVEGYSEKTANKYIIGVPKFKDFLKQHPFLSINSKNTQIKHGKLSGKTFVLTGTRALEKIIIDLGGKISSSVSNNIFAVIAKDKDSASSKLQKATKLNIMILTPEEFTSKYT